MKVYFVQGEFIEDGWAIVAAENTERAEWALRIAGEADCGMTPPYEFREIPCVEHAGEIPAVLMVN